MLFFALCKYVVSAPVSHQKRPHRTRRKPSNRHENAAKSRSRRHSAAHNGLVAGLEARKCKRRQASADDTVSTVEFPHQIRPWLAQSRRSMTQAEAAALLSLGLDVRLQKFNVVHPKGLGELVNRNHGRIARPFSNPLMYCWLNPDSSPSLS